ncbi:MAG: SDR family NAD(P)-dependent oxidoreductase [Deltaproteobacteria bacterium]|nr:SDR family NAD(P)-dependent oxidoreductase [Deltaproteobacteria bacterium]MBW1910418.1 SDR family NAD(P)-dependent oxidoreductase [Deltaproteobacteria bacterium]MBW2035472.1 SDR family NAD(P)-dependent oxidoreductase [Deltaproteobacteria bacterium]MBW2115107.1 SDR family NAD(P)-dependent oxidoreductase [Deltaproteobacteria bacterium]MBW2170324.1 SDR family NAD(P)-dependent oxidoreductase [Deltaproteobacteria bacterium]
MGEKGQTALVTGASSGIGRETAIRLAEKGFQVIVAARRIDRLNKLADQVQGITPKQVDLSEPENIESFCKYLSDLKDPVTVLINNAGYSVRGAVEDVSLKDIRRLFEVNLFALIRVTQACLPGMRGLRSGTIINLSSIVGKFIFPMSGVYAASKHAVEAISDALRIELRPLGIRVVTIRPGVIATEFNEVGIQMTGDLMSRTDPDYKTVYETAGAGVGKMFAGISLPGPDLIADTIIKAVFSDAPRAVYSAGPMSDEFLGQRFSLDDDAFDRFMTDKVGLTGLKV